jgi:hypothetical protein
MALKSVESRDVEFKSNRRDKYLKVITNKEYQVVCELSRQTAARELLHMTRSNIFIRHGKTGRDTYYTLTGKATGRNCKRKRQERGRCVLCYCIIIAYIAHSGGGKNSETNINRRQKQCRIKN